MTLPPTTTKQQEILQLIYRYRFIDRIQIQALMGHKDRRRIGAWLKDLREKHYVEWIYDDTNLTNKTKPAIYYLGLNGIRFLRTNGEYLPDELRKRYHESSRQPGFIDRCLLIAGCGVSLEAKTVDGVHYSFVTETDYIDPDNEYYFLSEELRPQLCFIKETSRIKESYLLEVFDPKARHYMVKKRLRDYIAYLTSGEWEDETGDDKPPIVLIACPSRDEFIYAKRLTRKLLENIVDNDDENDDETIRIRFATTEQVKREGVTGIIWEDI
jgi:hypothetical protein